MIKASDLKEIASQAISKERFISILMGKAKDQAEMGSYSVNVTIPVSIGENEAVEIRKHLNEQFGFVAKLTVYKGFRMIHVSWR